MLDSAVDDSVRLRTIVDELLDLARLEAGRLTMEIAPSAPQAIVDAALQAMRTRAQAAEARLETDVAPDMSDVAADPRQVERVLVNLIANSLQHVPPGGRILVGTDVIGDVALFTVADNGPGIPLMEQSRIFDRFTTPTARSGGSGLGLSIARQIVLAHGGDIWVDSGPGPGAVFSFTIPLYQAGPASEEVAS
jgi:signal transduction histidine kinase